MTFDQNLLFADNDNLAAGAGNVLLSKSVDSRTAGTPILGGPLTHNFGAANPRLKIALIVTQAFTSGGAATMQWQVVQADDGPLATNLEVLRQSAVIGFAGFTLGKIIDLGQIPPMSREFLGVRLVIGTAATTAGKVTGGLTPQVPSNASNLMVLAA
jgi:hypothetical protein